MKKLGGFSFKYLYIQYRANFEVFRWNISLRANLLFLKSVKSTVTSSSFFSILFIFYLPCSSFGLRCPWRPKDFLVRCPDISIPVHQWQRTKDCHLEPTLGNLRLDCQLCKWPEINQRLLKQNWYYCTECIYMYWFLNIEVLLLGLVILASILFSFG